MDRINADSRPSTKQLLPYLAHMAPSWYEVGAVLLEVEQESELELIQANNVNDKKRCCLCMLQYWMRTHPKATWHHLIAALRSPGVDLSVLATEIEENFTVDHIQRSDESSAIVNFAVFKNVLDAFAELIRIFRDELSDVKFGAIHTNCVIRADERLRSKICRTTNIDSLFTLLACFPLYFNWMKVDYLEAIAAASGIAKLKETVKCYTDVILFKRLGEIWNDVPSFYKLREKYYSKVEAKFPKRNPDDIQVKDLIKYEPRFAKKIALKIMQIKKGSLVITWCIAAEEAYEAYLLALNIPQELREDDFLQIGMWVAYHPQSVILELERVHTMMPTTTLLIGYYHGLLLNSIDADLLIDKMCSVGLLSVHEQNVISSGYSIYQKNWLLLEHVRQMKVQAVMTFCDLIQQIWPEIAVKLITALKCKDASATDKSYSVTSEVKQDDVKVADVNTTSSVQLLFLYLIDQICKLLQKHRLEIIQQCKSLNASDIHEISLFSADQIIKLSECSNLFVKLCPIFTWSNHSVLKTLSICSSDAIKLLDKFKSSLDPLQPITSYPVPHLSSSMIPTDTSSYTILAIRCDKELYQCTLQYVYDVQSVMVERCDITQHCLQLLAVRNDPTMLYWTFSKCVVDLINTNIPLNSDYLYSRGILEVLVYPDLLLTTGDDVCYGSLAFDCSDQLFSEELEISDIATDDQIKDNSTEDILKHVRSQCDSLRSELQEKTKYSELLEETLNTLKMQGDGQTHEKIMTTEDSPQAESVTHELDKELTSIAVDVNEELREKFAELKKNNEKLIAENQKTKITINQLEEEVNEKKLKGLNLERENNRLRHLLNKYHEGKDTNKTSVDFQNEKALTGGNNSEQQVECSKPPKTSSDNGVNQLSIKWKESDERNPFSEDRKESSDQPSIGGKKPDKISPSSESQSIKVMLEKLEQAKANNETLKVSYTTILFSGSSGVGKTSLLKKLNKENLSRYHHSTGVAQSKHTVCIKTTAVIKSAKGLHWVDLDYDSLINHLNKHLHNLRFPSLTLMSAASLSLERDTSTHLDESLPNPKILSQSSNAASSSMGNTPDATTSKSVMKQNRETVAKAHLAAVDIAKADSSDTPELGDVWDIINFLDTGGQPEFVNILPAVSSSIALTFIVFNLSKRLNDFVRVEHYVNGDPSFNPYDLDCTNLEFIKHLMVSSENFNKNISSSLILKGTQRKDGGNDSKICYVGTHAFNIKEEEIEKIDDQLSSIASELELHQRSFWSSPESQLERLFPIDMFSNGKEQESYEKTIQVIRDNIQRQVQERDYYELPIIWFIFLLNLQKLCNIKKSSYISYQEAVEVWRDESVSENDVGNESDEDLCDDQHVNVSQDMSDVHNVLLFFHFIGMLFYYHKVEGLCDYVFIDRQWLFEKLTELVEIKFTKGYSKEDINAEDIEKFTMEGILNINIIKNLKINLQGIKPLYFIYLLDHLNIVAPIDSRLNDYFMPCVLPSFSPTKPLEKPYDLDKCYGSIQHEPLLVGFKNGPMPHGFFCQLIVELLKSLPTSWKSPLLSTSRMQHAYNNLITFPTTIGHAVSLFYKIGYIEVQIRHKSSQSSVIHYNVRHELDKILKAVSSHLQLNTEQLCYGFYCKCEEIQHFAKLKSLISPMEYIPCGYGYTKVTEDYRVWLQEPEDISSQPTVQIVKDSNMKWMHKIIIPNISYCWKIVADYLEYPAVKKWEIEEKQRGDPYKCCAELMEDWLTSDRGVAPKTWQTLMSVLKDIQGLSTSSIEQCLLKEGLLSPPETVSTLQTAAVTLPSAGTNENRNEALRKDTLQMIDNISANTTENASQK